MENTDQSNNQVSESSSLTSQTPPVIPEHSSSVIFSSTGNPSPIGSKPAKKFSIKLIIGIVLFLLIAGSAAGFYLFKQQSLKTAATPTPSPIAQKQTPTPSPTGGLTADWQTYQGDEFTFEYPTNAKVETSSASGLLILPINYQQMISSSITNHDLYDKAYKIGINIENNPNNLTAMQFVEKIIKDMESKGDPTLDGTAANARKTLKEYSVAGLEGVSVEIYHSEPYMSLYFTNEAKAYIIRIVGDEGKPSTVAQKTVDQILSTFKFTGNGIEMYENSIVYEKLTSPDGSFKIMLVGSDRIIVEDKSGQIITDDAINDSTWEALMLKIQKANGLKSQGQTGMHLNGWKNSTIFGVKILNAFGNEFEIDVDASKGIIIESTFKMTK